MGKIKDLLSGDQVIFVPAKPLMMWSARQMSQSWCG